MNFERKPPSEDADIAELTRTFLVVQQRFAAQQKRALGRGTHTKGVCCRATFEVFDLEQTIADPALRARLARGVFARPGVYPATVRFANAASTVLADSKADVRAMSFSIEAPGPGGVPQRHDYTMNNAPVFPINDAHDFAAFMRMRARASGLGQLWEFLKLPFRDKRAILRIAKLGKSQTKPPQGPYQQTRFWSNVPFLHGQDEAIKYSAIPAGTNAGRPVGKGENVLRDELARHLSEDPEPASFDFGVQLLDAGRMTHEGNTQDVQFWVENAVPEWKESEAPFHRVARLTLERNSILPDDQCQAAYIDVTQHSTPDSRPIGGINRARWSPEASSRKARMANTQEQTMTAPGGLRVRTVLKYAGAVLGAILLGVFLLALITVIRTHRNHGTLPPEPRAELVYADQGWGSNPGAPARQTYYYTAQGAGLKDLRYSWFVHLERPLSTQRLAEPQFMRRFGFVVDGASPKNPDGLPVGFSKHFDRDLNEEMLDLTCAACHTGQLNITRGDRTTAIRIDGGSAIHAFTDSNLGHFVPTLMSSIASTAFNPLKFRRFAAKVLGDHDLSASLTLHRQMLGVLGQLGAMGVTEKWHKLVPTEEGYGRTDALARISNTVFGDHLGAENYQVANAPVNYPPIWNIWKFDWVQYNASVSQPMARNIGESMGTGAKYTLVNRYGQPLPAHERFRSTTLLENLHTIELTLRTLKPPAWHEQVMGAIDWPKAEEGKRLFNEYCVGCHGPHIAPPEIKTLNSPLKTAEDPEWLMRTVCVDDIGTDPNTAMNFDRATVDIRKTGLTQADLQRVARRTAELWNTRQAAAWHARIAALSVGPQSPDTAREIADLRARIANQGRDLEQSLAAIDPAKLKVGAALSYLGTMIRDNAYADGRYTAAEQADRDGYGILDMPQVLPAYKPRPLAGIWASPPFLHNGSVPTIYDLLSPVEERPARFRVGSREFDTTKLGLAEVGEPYWVLDTSKDGNSNRGHEFSRKYVENPAEGTHAKNGTVGPYLTPEQRYAIIEHLKVRNDDVDGPKEPHVPPQCAPTAPTQYARESR